MLAVSAAAVLMMFGSTACATKKYVRQTVSPVEARVSGVEDKTNTHASAIGELENNVSRADEKASEADRRAREAGEAAGRANEAAVQARSRADSAYTMSEQNATRVGELASNLQNINNYQLVTTESVLFPLNRHTLTKQAKEQLDQAVGNMTSNRDFIVEVRGFTDPSGSRETNLALSQRRADSVVRYLTAEHNVPLRRIHVLGLGEEVPLETDLRGREARKQARRVELKVFALDMSGQQSAQLGTQPDVSGTRSRSMDSSTTGSTQQQPHVTDQSGTTQSGSTTPSTTSPR
jgi:outer membrane protein OmpA-like peptidoglycan-associated protein